MATTGAACFSMCQPDLPFAAEMRLIEFTASILGVTWLVATPPSWLANQYWESPSRLKSIEKIFDVNLPNLAGAPIIRGK